MNKYVIISQKAMLRRDEMHCFINYLVHKRVFLTLSFYITTQPREYRLPLYLYINYDILESFFFWNFFLFFIFRDVITFISPSYLFTINYFSLLHSHKTQIGILFLLSPVNLIKRYFLYEYIHCNYIYFISYFL